MKDRFETIWDLIPEPRVEDPGDLRDRVSVRWTVAVDEPTWAGPTASGGHLYVAGERGGVRSLTADAGDVEWTATVDAPVRVRPAIDGGRVFIRRSGPDPGVTALDATTGERCWRETIAGDADPPFDALGTGDGRVYVGGSGPSVRALSAADGSEQWTFETAGTVRSAPATGGDVVAFGSEDGNVYAVDRATGEERWRFDAGEAVTGSPTVEGDAVYVGSANRTDDGRQFGRVWALDRSTGDPRWVFDADGAVRVASTLVGETVVAADDSGLAYGLYEPTGEGIWAVHVGGQLSPPAGGDGAVYVGSERAEVRAIDAETGHRQWIHGGEGTDVVAAPVVADGLVFAHDRRGRVYALESASE